MNRTFSHSRQPSLYRSFPRRRETSERCPPQSVHPDSCPTLLDPWEKNEPGLGFGRDPSRTPMQWSAEPQGVFSTARPWLPLAADFEAANVDTLNASPDSLLSFYGNLIALCRPYRALVIGAFGLHRYLGVSGRQVAGRGGTIPRAGGCPGRCRREYPAVEPVSLTSAPVLPMSLAAKSWHGRRVTVRERRPERRHEFRGLHHLCRHRRR